MEMKRRALATISVEAQDTGVNLRIYPHLGYGMCVMGNETSYDTGAITRMIVSAQNRVHHESDLVR